MKWDDGAAHPASPNAGQFEPLTLAELAAKAPQTGGPIGAGRAAQHRRAPDGGFGTHIFDVEVDHRYRHRHASSATPPCRTSAAPSIPSYVEGQMQGGVAQGIGWALNEEYIYNDDGKVDNPSFLDYRMPVARTCR